jgi:hypothetical protein
MSSNSAVIAELCFIACVVRKMGSMYHFFWAPNCFSGNISMQDHCSPYLLIYIVCVSFFGAASCCSASVGCLWMENGLSKNREFWAISGGFCDVQNLHSHCQRKQYFISYYYLYIALSRVYILFGLTHCICHYFILQKAVMGGISVSLPPVAVIGSLLYYFIISNWNSCVLILLLLL